MLVSNKNVELRPSMIKKIDNSNEALAHQIFTVFQRSYKIEAQLIGTLDFPPLFRSAKDIENSKTHFYSFIENECNAAVIEVAFEDQHLAINSLTVDPDYFRKGIASKLISHVLNHFDFKTATVETAVVNLPAIKLYTKHGFVEYKKWTPSHGIEKVAMLLKAAI
jgi:ribosomal protein S18 acetylase RimI-like enzyme